MDSVKPVVLVGVRDSAASRVALRWAASEARRRHGPLLVISSWDPVFDAPYATGSRHLTADQQRIAAGHRLSDLVAAAFGPQLPSWVTAELHQGVPERVLVEQSARASMLVLGSAAPPPTIARSIGPVIRGCLSRAQCPVMVISADQPEIDRQRVLRECVGHARTHRHSGTLTAAGALRN